MAHTVESCVVFENPATMLYYEPIEIHCMKENLVIPSAPRIDLEADNDDIVAVKPRSSFLSNPMSATEFVQKLERLDLEGGEFLNSEFNNINKEGNRNSLSFLKCSEAKTPEALGKTPLQNIMPFDFNRVVLNSPLCEGNFINASLIGRNSFIATVHPNNATLQEFLQLIYQYEASMVVMLTTKNRFNSMLRGESDRTIYFPNKESTLNCHPFLVETRGSVESNAFIKQELVMKHVNSDNEFLFTQFISTAWNEEGCVLDFPSIIALLQRISRHKKVSNNPIIIHCEDGVAKSGVLLASYFVIKELRETGTIDVCKHVMNLRRERMEMIPTRVCKIKCYYLIHDTLKSESKSFS